MSGVRHETMATSRSTESQPVADVHAPEIDFSSWCDFFQGVSRFVERQHGLANPSFTEYAILRLSTTIRSLHTIEEAHEDSEDLEVVTDDVKELADVFMARQSLWSSYEEALRNSLCVQRVPSTVQSSGVEVPQEQIEYLRYLSFSWTSIASILGVSRTTVYRRKREYGISSANCSMTDSELDTCLRDIRRELPYSGETIIMGRLRNMQYCVPRKHIRESLRRIDPLYTPLRWGRNRHSRRPYSVPGPNSLWHLGECLM